MEWHSKCNLFRVLCHFAKEIARHLECSWLWMIFVPWLTHFRTIWPISMLSRSQCILWADTCREGNSLSNSRTVDLSPFSIELNRGFRQLEFVPREWQSKLLLHCTHRFNRIVYLPFLNDWNSMEALEIFETRIESKTQKEVSKQCQRHHTYPYKFLRWRCLTIFVF